MRKLSLLKWPQAAWLGALLSLISGAGSVHAQDDPGWAQHIWLGPQVAFNINAKFGLSGQFPISGSRPGPTGVSGADHFYNDGYVRVDQTGNAQGFTSFWGYQNAGQNDAANHALLMHNATAYSASASSTGNDEPYFGLQLGYGADPWRWGSFHLGLEFAFGFLPVRISANQPIPALVSQSVYSFDTGGIVLPTAPITAAPAESAPRFTT